MTLLLATLATRMRPCWMILWPWAWTLGTDALGASRRGGGPEPLCCCCWRRLAICWAVMVMGCRKSESTTSSWHLYNGTIHAVAEADAHLSSSDQRRHDDLGVVFGRNVLAASHQRGRDHCA